MQIEPNYDLRESQVLIDFFKTQPVRKVYLFGSRARRDAKSDSDMDLLVEVSEPLGLKFIRLKLDLEDLLGLSVDLLATDGISNHIQPYIERDKILIYEKV